MAFKGDEVCGRKCLRCSDAELGIGLRIEHGGIDGEAQGVQWFPIE